MAKCIGCGAQLQSHDPNLIGYIPPHLVVESDNNLYCKRCFDITHYGKIYKPTITNKAYYERIDVIKNIPSIVLLMIDVMDITGGFIPNLYKHIGNNPVIVLINKVDLLPKDIHLNQIEERVREIALKEKLNITNVYSISSKKKKNIDSVLKKILKLQEEYDYKNKNIYHHVNKSLTKIYLLGCASVGKSTFVNILKTDYLKDNNLITTSPQMQTTLEFINVYIDKYHYFIDTPGFINYHSYQVYLDTTDNEILNPKAYLKPKTYQLNSDQTIYLGGLVRLDMEADEKINVSFYTSNMLYIHRTKREKADEIFNAQITKLLIPPKEYETFERIKEFKTYEFNVDGSKELIISGIGFVHLKGNNIKVKCQVFNKVDVQLVDGFI